MDNSSSNRKCQVHNESVIATSLNSSSDEQNRYFCSKCLVLKINDKSLHTNPDAQQRIDLMKSEFEKKTKNLTNQNKDVLKQFSQNILTFKGFLDQILNEINSSILNEISRLENLQEQIEESIRTIDIYNFDKIEAAQRLLDQQFSKFRTSIHQQILLKQKIEKDFFDLIQQNLQYLEELKDEVQILIWQKTEQETQDENQIATPGLKIFCQKHKTEIIAFDLNPQRAKENRLACIYCIEQNTIPYSSLIRVIEKWKKYEELKKSKLLSIQQKHQDNKQVIIQQLALIHNASQQKNEELTKSLKEFCYFIDGSVNKLIGQMGRNWSTQTQKEILDNVDILSKSIQNDEVILNEDNYYQKEETQINRSILDSIEKIKETCLQCCQRIQNTVKVSLRETLTTQQ